MVLVWQVVLCELGLLEGSFWLLGDGCECTCEATNDYDDDRTLENCGGRLFELESRRSGAYQSNIAGDKNKEL
jgi:hypothetical protein